jgi:hypothetical protein
MTLPTSADDEKLLAENLRVIGELLHDFPTDVLRKLGRAWRHLLAERAPGHLDLHLDYCPRKPTRGHADTRSSFQTGEAA